jgi:hypothetical protein
MLDGCYFRKVSFLELKDFYSALESNHCLAHLSADFFCGGDSSVYSRFYQVLKLNCTLRTLKVKNCFAFGLVRKYATPSKRTPSLLTCALMMRKFWKSSAMVKLAQ